MALNDWKKNQIADIREIAKELAKEVAPGALTGVLPAAVALWAEFRKPIPPKNPPKQTDGTQDPW